MFGSPSAFCLFGAGGHGRVVAEQMIRRLNADICFGDTNMQVGDKVSDIEVLYSDVTKVGARKLIITIGNNAARRELFLTAEVFGCSLAHFIADPQNYFAGLPGAGTMVMAGALVTKDAHIGKGVIVNTGAIVEHDSEIGDFCHLAPGSAVAGGAKLGEGVFLGANATVINGVSVAAGSIVGAGSVVVRDIVRPGTYIGVPVRQSRK